MKARLVFPSLAVLLTLTIAAQSDRRTVEAAPAITANELGRLLFWDPILSGNKDVACATCHHPDYAYADGRELSLGVGSVGLGPSRTDLTGGEIPVVKRNSPTVLNTVFNGLDRRRRNRRSTGTPSSVDQTRAPMFWDSRVRSLEEQALEPIKAFEEMRGSAYPEDVAVDSAVARLQANAEYVVLFGEAFGSRTSISEDQLAEAMAEFQRSLVAMNSPFDRFQAGDRTAMTAQQQRGFREFDDAGCDRCHRGRMFSNYNLHAEGVEENPLLAVADTGAGRFRFRTPTLRNVALTAPYMHNGMLATLDDVLRFYDNGRSENPNVVNGRGRRGDRRGDRRGGDRGVDRGVAQLSGSFRRVDDMSDQEMLDIVAFLEALTDEDFDKTIPTRVPSGLPPGGLIQGRYPLSCSADYTPSETHAAGRGGSRRIGCRRVPPSSPRRSSR
jgi:cytochrome c peroxidase